MAELDDKLLKNLDKTLEDMTTHLRGIETALKGVKNGLEATFNPAILKSFSDELRGMKAARLIDAEDNVSQVNKIYSAIQEFDRRVKTGTKLEFLSEAQIEKYKQELNEIERRLDAVAGKRLKGEEWLDRKALYDRRDMLRDIVTSDQPAMSVPLSTAELKEAVELLKRYKELYANITKGEQQRAVELANIKKKEAEESLKQELQLNKEIAAEEKKRQQEAESAAKQRLKEAQDANKAWTQAADAEQKAQAKMRGAQSKQAYKEQADAIQQQIVYQKQLMALRKEYIALNQKKERTEKESADLERIKTKIKEIINLSKQLNKEQAGTHNIAFKATEYERFRQSIKGATKATKEHNSELNKMLPTLQRLASAFGIAFSIRGLAQFGKKLIEVRGEFEMQFVAMKQIIGDVDAATKIWNQTMQQALQSPFKAMQLVTYTKQLAAYRIETEKLFDTTKRLADVSAGLGVDMGRLILAYGQVKSANFLRASEVRQFTEAGVNIVGNLADYFSEIENRAVSTSDVMERITKRMVMFSDVEEIFRRMTDEGGTFFNMQEIQAKTVKGQIMKLRDAYDQMLNTIGMSNEGTLKNMISALNDIVRHWRSWAAVIKSIGFGALVGWLTQATTALLGFKVAGIAAGAATVRLTNSIKALGQSLKANWVTLLISAVVAIGAAIVNLTKKNEELARTLDNVGAQNASNLQTSIDEFTKLIDKLDKATEGSEAYLEIRNKIQSQYGEYLDNLDAEAITVENLADAYDRVVERMREKTRQHIVEEGMGEIASWYGNKLIDFQKQISGFKFTSGLVVSEGEAVEIAKKMYNLYAKDGKYRGLQNPVSLLKDALEDFYGSDAVANLNYAQLSLGNDFYKAIEQRYKNQIELEIKANSLTQATANSHQQYLDQLALEEEHQKNIEKIKNDSTIQSKGRRELAYEAESLRYEEKKLELQAQYQKKSDEWLKNEKAKLKENYGAFLNAYNEQVKAYIGEAFGDTDWMSKDDQKAHDAYNFMKATTDRLSQGQTKWEEKILNDKKLTEENIQRIKEQQATQTAADSEAAKALNESLKQEEDRLELIKKQMELLGLHEKDKKGGGTDTIYSDRIRLLQRMFEAYKKAAKEAYSFAVAEGKVKDSFEDEWVSLMPAGYGAEEVPTSYDALKTMLERLKAFTPQFDKDGKLTKAFKDLMSAVSDATYHIDFEVSVEKREDLKKQIESMFENYELTLDLEKLSLPAGELANIFGYQITTLDMIEEKIKDGVKLLEDAGYKPEEAVKIVEGLQNKLDDITRKALVNRLKTYTAYLEKGRDEAVKIHLDELKKMAELDDLYNAGYYTSTQYKDIQSKIRKETDQALAKNKWEDFKKSDFYVTMFEDMGNVADVSIDIMIKKLKDLKDNVKELDPTQVKEIVKAIDKLEKTKRSRSLFGTFMDDRRLKKEWINTPDTTDDWLSTLTHDEQVWQARHDVIAKKVAELTQEYNEAIKSGDTERAKELQQQIDVTTSGLNHVNDVLEETRKNIADITNEQNEGYAAWVRYHMGVAKGAQDFSNAAQAAGTIAEEMMTMFSEADNASKKLAHDLAEIAVNAGLLVADIAKAIASEGTDVGAMIDGLVRTWNIIKGAISASEKEINQAIESNKIKLEELAITLERVKKARDKAWDTQAVVSAAKATEDAINQQIKAYTAMMNAEKERKGTDWDAVRQYEQAIDELKEALKDEKEQLIEIFGGLGESAYKGEAQNFVDAWKEAFLETGDGLQGLQDHFDEFLNEWFVKQATMRVAGRMLEPLFRQIDNAVDQYGTGGTSVLLSELQAIREKFAQMAPDISANLEALAGTFGLGEGEGGLSGLAAGIQGMTEEQANILEAYWNSVRGYTASIDMNVSRIADMLGAGSRDITNPQLQQLQLIAANAQATHQLLLSTSKSGHPMGGYGFKVFND